MLKVIFLVCYEATTDNYVENVRVIIKRVINTKNRLFLFVAEKDVISDYFISENVKHVIRYFMARRKSSNGGS